MSLKNVFGEEHAKLYVKYRPVAPPTLIERTIAFLREKYDGPLYHAVDLGCGNGQCTFPWASKFSSVLGVDLSPAQISEAQELSRQMKVDNVEFKVSPAENIPLPDNSVQLITICKAAQWMDLQKVYEEAKRVLVKNGVFAVIGYWGPVYTPIKDESMTDPINKIVQQVMKSTRSESHKEIWDMSNENSNISIPFEDAISDRGYPYQQSSKLQDITGCIRSYSSFQSMARVKGENYGKALLGNMETEIIAALSGGREEALTTKEIESYEFTATWDYFVLMGRK